MPLLRLDGLSKRFGPTVALDGVSFALDAGQVHALIGENGAGKSTLMNVLAGSLQPDAGRMEIAGKPYAPSSPHDASRSGIVLIHQELSLCPHLTVAENVLLGREPSRWGVFRRTEAEQLAIDVLQSFTHPELRPDRLVGELPLAAQQVVEICRAVASRARIILMDEPTSSLQRDDVGHLFALIARLKRDGLGVIYISHFLEEVREIADVFTVLRDGRSVVSGSIDSVTNDDLVAHMVGRSVDQLFPDRHNRLGADVVLDVKDLAAPPVVKQASFTLRRGEVLGIAGLMGSGRTELVASAVRPGACRFRARPHCRRACSAERSARTPHRPGCRLPERRSQRRGPRAADVRRRQPDTDRLCQLCVPRLAAPRRTALADAPLDWRAWNQGSGSRPGRPHPVGRESAEGGARSPAPPASWPRRKHAEATLR